MNNGRKAQNIALNDLVKVGLHEQLNIARPFIYHCEADWSWSPPPLQDFDLWIIISGKGKLEIHGGGLSLSAGACFLFQPGDAPRCSHSPADPLVVFACHFKSGGNGAMQRIRASLVHVALMDFDYLRRSGEMAVRSYDDGASGRLLAAVLVAQMVIHLFHEIGHAPRDGASAHSCISDLGMEIRSRPGESWSVPAMAKQCALSMPHFKRKFRETFGLSPVRYVIRQRMRRAITLLRESDMTIQQIADALGFRDVFFFHRQFRTVTGATPRTVRLGEITKLDEA